MSSSDRNKVKNLLPHIRLRLLPVLAVLLMAACSSISPELQAATQAQSYYQALAKGDAISFLEGKAGIENQPGNYCEQLLKAVEQYHDEIEKKHGGLNAIKVSDNMGQKASNLDTLNNKPYIETCLILCYSDSTEEEIIVPMVEVDGEWKMK